MFTELVFVQVNIQVPAPDQQSHNISITGLASQLDRAKEGLLERVKELQAEQEDRVSIWEVCVTTSIYINLLIMSKWEAACKSLNFNFSRHSGVIN